jgi:hypothetical protein
VCNVQDDWGITSYSLIDHGHFSPQCTEFRGICALHLRLPAQPCLQPHIVRLVPLSIHALLTLDYTHLSVSFAHHGSINGELREATAYWFEQCGRVPSTVTPIFVPLKAFLTTMTTISLDQKDCFNTATIVLCFTDLLISAKFVPSMSCMTSNRLDAILP